MKRLVEEVNGEGLEGLIGKNIVVWCVNYFYTGKLVGVNDSDIKLTDAAVVYETGPLQDKQFKDSQPLPNDWYIRVAAIESYGERHA